MSNQLKFCLALLLGSLLAACVSTETSVPSAKVPPPAPAPSAKSVRGDPPGGYTALRLGGDYAGYAALQAFVDELVEQHGFSRPYLTGLFSEVHRKTWTIEYMNREKPTVRQKPGGWSRYRAKFLDARHIEAGVDFWRSHRASLQRAESTYGVPPEIILGIMGVETLYGANVGRHRVIDALTTLAFDYPRRADYFKDELLHLLVMAREEGFDPLRPQGSFAGAMGLGQFMPGSFLDYAVDFDGNGRRDLWNPDDAIGSIANYFKSFGWERGEPVERSVAAGPEAAGLKDGFETRYSLDELAKYGVRPKGAIPRQSGPFSLLRLSTTEGDDLRIGFKNFYVITRYNHSTYYAMAVYELGQAIRRRFQG